MMQPTNKSLHSYINSNNNNGNDGEDDDSSVTTMGDHTDDDDNSSIDLLAPSPPPKKEQSPAKEQHKNEKQEDEDEDEDEENENAKSIIMTDHALAVPTLQTITTMNEDFGDHDNDDAAPQASSLVLPSEKEKEATASTLLSLSALLLSQSEPTAPQQQYEKSTSLPNITPARKQHSETANSTTATTRTPPSSSSFVRANDNDEYSLPPLPSPPSFSGNLHYQQNEKKQSQQKPKEQQQAPESSSTNTIHEQQYLFSPATQTLNILSQRDANDDEDLRYDMSQLEMDIAAVDDDHDDVARTCDNHDTTVEIQAKEDGNTVNNQEKKKKRDTKESDNNSTSTATNTTKMDKANSATHACNQHQRQDKVDTHYHHHQRQHPISKNKKNTVTKVAKTTKKKQAQTATKHNEEQKKTFTKNTKKTLLQTTTPQRSEYVPNNNHNNNNSSKTSIPSLKSSSRIQHLIGSSQLVRMDDLSTIFNYNVDDSTNLSAASIPLHLLIATAQYEPCQVGSVMELLCKHCRGTPSMNGGKYVCTHMDKFTNSKFGVSFIRHISQKCPKCPLSIRKAVKEYQEHYSNQNEKPIMSQSGYRVKPSNMFLRQVWNRYNRKDKVEVGGNDEDSDSTNGRNKVEEGVNDEDRDSYNGRDKVEERGNDGDSDSDEEEDASSSLITPIENLIGDNILINLKNDRGSVPDLWLALTAQLEPKPSEDHQKQVKNRDASVTLRCKHCKGNKKRPKRNPATGNFVLSRSKIISGNRITTFHSNIQRHMTSRCDACPPFIRKVLVDMNRQKMEKFTKQSATPKSSCIEFWERVLNRGLTNHVQMEAEILSSNVSSSSTTALATRDSNLKPSVTSVVQEKQTRVSSTSDVCEDVPHPKVDKHDGEVPFVRVNIEISQPGPLGMVVSRGPVSSDGQETCFVRKVLEGSQADKAQLIPGDVLAKISLSTTKKEYITFKDVMAWGHGPRPLHFSIFRLVRSKSKDIQEEDTVQMPQKTSSGYASSPLKELLSFSQKEVISMNTKSPKEHKERANNETSKHSPNVPTLEKRENSHNQGMQEDALEAPQPAIDKHVSSPSKELLLLSQKEVRPTSTESSEELKEKPDNETRENSPNAPRLEKVDVSSRRNIQEDNLEQPQHTSDRNTPSPLKALLSSPPKEAMSTNNKSSEEREKRADNKTSENSPNACKKELPVTPEIKTAARMEYQDSSLEVPFCRACKDKTHNSVLHHALCPKNPLFETSGAEEMLESIRRGVQIECPACTFQYQNGRKPKHLTHSNKCERNKKTGSSTNECTSKRGPKLRSSSRLPTTSRHERQAEDKSKRETSNKKVLQRKNTRVSSVGPKKRANSHKKSLGKANKKVKSSTSNIAFMTEDIEANPTPETVGNNTTCLPLRGAFGDHESDSTNELHSTKPNWISCPDPWGPAGHAYSDVVLFSPCDGFKHHESFCSSERFSIEPFCSQSDYYRTHTSPKEGYHVLKLSRDRMSLRPWGFSVRRHDFGGACLVQTVEPISPAQSAIHVGSTEGWQSSTRKFESGLQMNDMIICINGTEVGGMTEVGFHVELQTCGSELLVVVSRYKNSSDQGNEGCDALLGRDEIDSSSLIEWAEFGAGNTIKSKDTKKDQPLQGVSNLQKAYVDAVVQPVTDCKSRAKETYHDRRQEQKDSGRFTREDADQESPQHEPSDYELLRLRNIQRNNARLKALGLLEDKPVKQERKRTNSHNATSGADKISLSLGMRLKRTQNTDPSKGSTHQEDNSLRITPSPEHCEKMNSKDNADQKLEVTGISTDGRCSTRPIQFRDQNNTQESLGKDDSDGWEDDEEPWLGCVCGKIHPKPVKVFWIQCDDCEAWYNVSSKCVGFGEKEAESLGTWNCLACSGGILQSSNTSQKYEAVSDDETSVSSISSTRSGTTQNVVKVYAVGTVVKVASRTGPNENKLGGVGRISAVQTLQKGGISYDIKYVLGGTERNVDAGCVEHHDFGANSLSGRHSIGTRGSRSSKDLL